jgi:hypothetical protein
VNDHEMRQRAIEVRDAHIGNRRCPECPADPDNGRCESLAIWFPVIVSIGAGRHMERA